MVSGGVYGALQPNPIQRRELMKTFIGILLVGLLGFLGCSGSDNGTSTFTGEAVPVAPWAIIETTTPTYEWTPVHGATRYQLLVKNIAEETIIEGWFTAEEGECESEDGLCMVTPEVEIIGANNWMVLACLGGNCGLWSDALAFSYDEIGPKSVRFTDNGDGTVTENDGKQLMWTKDAYPGDMLLSWSQAVKGCGNYTFAGYSDWRLPTLQELRGLAYPHTFDPNQPLDHPFEDVQSGPYWTIDPGGDDYAWIVGMGSGIVALAGKGVPNNVWPVRSGS